MSGPPPALALTGVSLADLAHRHDLELVGDDRPVSHLALVRAARDQGLEDTLTYVTTSAYFDEFVTGDHDAAIVERRFAGTTSRPMLLCPDGSGEETFFRIHVDLVEQGRVPLVPADRASSARVHPSAVVMDHVQLAEDCVIDAGAVIYPNTVVAAGAHIQANAALGGDGFEVKYFGGRRRRVPHSGGVWLGPEATVGSSSCVDRGLFGTFTAIGTSAHIDNLVYVAHNVQIGEDCAVAGAAAILGSSRLGKGVWFGPSASCNPEVEFGDHSFVGTGAVVTRDVPAFTLVAGSPARPLGNVCRCRTRIELSGGSAKCGNCGAELMADDEGTISLLGPA